MTSHGEVDLSLQRGTLAGKKLASPPPGEEIVITGIAGLFPKCEDVYALRHNLFNKIDMVTKSMRWERTSSEYPERHGCIPNITKFDPGYFGVHEKEADAMDPVSRIIMEKVVEAIMDAGFHPSEFEGTKTGVFATAINSDSQRILYGEALGHQNYALTGVSRFMIPNRISYSLKLRGPAFSLDTACSGSMHALEEAYKAVRNGEVDAAIVAAATVSTNSVATLQFVRLGVLSPDGACKIFDESANGYVRAETISAFLVQKAKDSRRIYAKVMHVLTNCDGYKDSGITHPSIVVQRELLEEFYVQSGINPLAVDFLEAHGTGTRAGDAAEIIPIDEIFCKNRKKPMLVGSVKSNLGHTEHAAAACQIAKVITIMDTGFITPNLHYNKPRKGVEALQSGRIKVVTEVTPFESDTGLIAISSFGFGGANGHCALKWNEKIKLKNGLPSDNLPRLVCYSGRTEKALFSITNDLRNRSLDAEFVALLHKVFKFDTATHRYRGYTIISKQGEVCSSVNPYHQEKIPLSFIFGDVKNYVNVRKELLQVPIFSDTISRIEKKLCRMGVSSSKHDIENNNQESPSSEIVSGVVTQIAIFEIFKQLGIEPRCTFGFSYGEFANCYAKGECTIEQAVFLAYWVVKSINKEGKENYKEAKNILNNMNGHDSDDPFEKSKIKLRDNKLIEFFTEKILHPAKISNSFNVFEDSSVLVEIGTCEEARTIATEHERKYLASSCDGIVPVLRTLGSLYELGWALDLEKLYPAVDFPVSRGTPMISPLIKWHHERDWYILQYERRQGLKMYDYGILIQTREKEWDYLTGHVIDGHNLFPATGYLYLVWNRFAETERKILKNAGVVFEDVKFTRATNIPKDGSVNFSVSIHKSNGYFEVIENKVPVVSGRIKPLHNVMENEHPIVYNSRSHLLLKQEDIYKEFRLRGYNYSGQFKGIKEYNFSCSTGLVEWKENWVTFIDNMLQIQILNVNSRNLYVPISIDSIVIDPIFHLTFCEKKEVVPVYFEPNSRLLRSGGIEVSGLKASTITRRKPLAEPVLEKYVFIPNETSLTTEQSIRVKVQIMLEINYRLKVKVVELVNENFKEDQEILGPVIFDALSDLPLIHAEVTVLSEKPLELKNVTVANKPLSSEKDALLVVLNNGLSTEDILGDAFKTLTKDGYVLTRESITFEPSHNNVPADVEILTIHTTPSEKLILLTKTEQNVPQKVVDVSDNYQEFKWLSPLKKTANTDVIVLARDDPTSGILGLVNCMRREPGKGKIRCVFLQDEAPDFNLENDFYRKQLKKGLAINVYKKGTWGTYRHTLLDIKETEHSCTVHITRRGDLSSFKWIERNKFSSQESELVHIYYSALNFKDIVTASGRLQLHTSSGCLEHDPAQGYEFSGKTSTGRRVMGMCDSGGLATSIQTPDAILITVPDSWSLEDAATVPIVYSTVLYAFVMRAKIQRRQSVLIHAGTGGLGQAAINIAHYYGCDIFTTVGTQEKRDFIKQKFPMIKGSHIGNSRDTSFEQLILKKTKGRGVDIVLNCLAEEKLQASIRCTASGGTFLDVGKFDSLSDNPLYLNMFKRNIKFYGIHLDHYFGCDPTSRSAIVNILKDGIRNGSIKPLTRICFNSNEIEKVYRFMAGGRHIGKVLINIRREEHELFAKPSTKLLKAIPRYYCNPEGSYVITGGLGGFGLELAEWLVQRGARKLILSSRTGIKTGYQAYRIKSWILNGVKVEISTASISTEESCKNLLDKANALGTTVGIFNLAVVLYDALLENQTEENFEKAFAPKATATKLLDQLSRTMCPELSDFVVFSSVSCGRGNAGQTNYAMANSIMERICEKRKHEGYPALAIQWGAVGDVGLVAELQKEHKVLEIGGTLQQGISSCLGVMDHLMRQNNTIVSSIVVAEKRTALGSADSVVDFVANIIGIRDLKTVSPQTPFPELGMDSLMGVEIKQTLERQFDIDLTPQDIKTMTFARLHQIMSERESAKLEDTNKTQEAKSNVIKSLTTMNQELLWKVSGSEEHKHLVILLPGIQGFMEPMQQIVQSLKAEVWCTRYYGTSDNHTVSGIAKELLPRIKKLLSRKVPYFVVAHSYGCSIALELAALLEEDRLMGTLVLIDGAPENLAEVVKQEFGNEVCPGFEINILKSVVPYFVSAEAAPFITEKLHKCANFQERIDAIGEVIRPSVEYAKEDIKVGLTLFYKRTTAVLDYSPKFNKIQSTVKLYRPTEESLQINIDQDYGLHKLVEKQVDVEFFEGNHLTILQNSSLCDAIGRLLSNLDA